MRPDYNHEVLATEREPEGQAKRSKSGRTFKKKTLRAIRGKKPFASVSR